MAAGSPTETAWIKTIAEDEAAGVIRKHCDGNKRSWGGVDDIIMAQSESVCASSIDDVLQQGDAP